MNWKARSAQLASLRRKHPPLRLPFPDLSVEQRTAPTSNRFAPVNYRPGEAKTTNLIVSHLHKSSYQVLLPSEVQYAGRKV